MMYQTFITLSLTLTTARPYTAIREHNSGVMSGRHSSERDTVHLDLHVSCAVEAIRALLAIHTLTLNFSPHVFPQKWRVQL